VQVYIGPYFLELYVQGFNMIVIDEADLFLSQHAISFTEVQ
jgi:hypothetical protein